MKAFLILNKVITVWTKTGVVKIRVWKWGSKIIRNLYRNVESTSIYEIACPLIWTRLSCVNGCFKTQLDYCRHVVLFVLKRVFWVINVQSVWVIWTENVKINCFLDFYWVWPRWAYRHFCLLKLLAVVVTQMETRRKNMILVAIFNEIGSTIISSG